MKSMSVICLIVLLFSQLSAAAVRGDKAQYIGGTLSIPEKQHGRLDATGETSLLFTWEKGKWEVPFNGIAAMEYGQKSGRRVGAAVAVSPVLLFSKKRKHFLTLQMKDASGKQEAAVFELSKGVYKQTLAALESRTGRKVDMQDADSLKEKSKEKK